MYVCNKDVLKNVTQKEKKKKEKKNVDESAHHVVSHSTVQIPEAGLGAEGADDATQGLNKARVQLLGILATCHKRWSLCTL